MLNVIACFGSTETNNYKMDTAVAWIRCLQHRCSPIIKLRQMGIDEIIIYGITELGELLVDEAVLRGYKVFGIMDRRVGCGGYSFRGIPVISRMELNHHIDKYIVVSSVTFWEEIEKELRKQGCQHIISLRELL